jgi:hypothetical protein
MQLENISVSGKILLLILLIADVTSLTFLIYALVYAKSETSYRRYALLIGLAFILLTQLTVVLLRRFNNKGQN